jgi:hypothetical protein
MKTTNTYWWRPGLYLRAVFVAGLLGLMLASWGLAADIAKKVAVDAVGNVYVTGKSDNIVGNSDYVTIKYDANGNWLWGRRYDGPYNEDKANALTVDAAGNVYVTGYSISDAGGNDYVTIKYGPNGNWLWGQRFNSPYYGGDVANALAVDTAGNVYVTGYSENSFNNFDYVTIKYGPNGNWLWGRRYDGPDFLPR